MAMTKLTKHGVRDLNAKRNAMVHEHRYFPNTYTARDGNQVTRMMCYCGNRQEETEDERVARQLESFEATRKW